MMHDWNGMQPVTYADWCLGRIAAALEQIAESMAPKPPPEGTPIPDGFPARDMLHVAGVVCLEQVPRTAAGLEAIGLNGPNVHRVLSWLRVNQ